MTSGGMPRKAPTTRRSAARVPGDARRVPALVLSSPAALSSADSSSESSSLLASNFALMSRLSGGPPLPLFFFVASSSAAFSGSALPSSTFHLCAPARSAAVPAARCSSSLSYS